MKKLFLGIAIALSAFTLQAQTNAPRAIDIDEDAYSSGIDPNGVFNHLGFRAGVGTTGVVLEAATPITRFVQLRAGVSFMPSIKIDAEVGVSYANSHGYSDWEDADIKADLKRFQGQVLFDIYPFRKGAFHVTVGAYFGGHKALAIQGHHADLASHSANGVIIIGDNTIPVNKDGYVNGGIKVNKFRPYVGLGWGRAIPNHRVNFGIDLGVQIHGKPSLYTEFGEIGHTPETDNNTLNKIMDKVKVYPTLTFSLGFRAF